MTFEAFGWMSYLTTQHPIHENLFWVFFSNATLKEACEEDEDQCRIVAINTFMMGVPIRVTQKDVAAAFDMPDKGLSDEYVGYLSTMLIPNYNALNLPLYERLLHLFISHFS